MWCVHAVTDLSAFLPSPFWTWFWRSLLSFLHSYSRSGNSWSLPASLLFCSAISLNASSNTAWWLFSEPKFSRKIVLFNDSFVVFSRGYVVFRWLSFPFLCLFLCFCWRVYVICTRFLRIFCLCVRGFVRSSVRYPNPFLWGSFVRRLKTFLNYRHETDRTPWRQNEDIFIFRRICRVQ